MGFSEEEIEKRFGFFLEVLRMGAPPHGGFALGIERFVALLAGEANIREILAFPKTASGSELMTGAPTEVPPEQLAELGITVIAEKD
jgi:aspartyl-tRNA synthetase